MARLCPDAPFLRIARGSASELEARVGVVDGEAARVLREHIEKLKASITNLEKQIAPS